MTQILVSAIPGKNSYKPTYVFPDSEPEPDMDGWYLWMSYLCTLWLALPKLVFGHLHEIAAFLGRASQSLTLVKNTEFLILFIYHIEKYISNLVLTYVLGLAHNFIISNLAALQSNIFYFYHHLFVFTPYNNVHTLCW